MRINVYSQELTNDVEIVEKEGTNEEGKSETFYGIRLYLHSSDMLHHTETDDDRSAITLWLPKSEDRRNALADTLMRMGELIWQ